MSKIKPSKQEHIPKWVLELCSGDMLSILYDVDVDPLNWKTYEGIKTLCKGCTILITKISRNSWGYIDITGIYGGAPVSFNVSAKLMQYSFSLIARIEDAID